MAPTPPNFAESLLTAYNGDQQAAHTAFAALLHALDLENDTPTAEEPEVEEPKPEPAPEPEEPTVPEPPLALAAITATCTAFTKRKKRCKNKVKKGSANGLCTLHQPDPESASSIFVGKFGRKSEFRLRLRKRVV